jgi:2-oxoglutarate dehydrogenase E1 component
MANQVDLSGASAHFVEAQYARYQADPSSVEDGWRGYFKDLEKGAEALGGNGGPSWGRSDWPLMPDDDLTSALLPGVEAAAAPKKKKGAVSEAQLRAATLDSIRALMLIRAYRVRGHMIANLDPLHLEEGEAHPELDPATYGFGDDDMDRPIFIDNVLGLESASLNEIIAILRRTYSSTLGIEFMHITHPDEKAWLQQRIEGRDKEIQFTKEGKLAIFEKLIEAEEFERFLGKKYTGTKRFGLDGGESAVPALDAILKTGGHLGMEELIIGMPHRGRLNVLANFMGKPFSAIFHEFHGGSSNPDDVEGSGDVKYHLGTSSDRSFDGNVVHLSLTANPSHLEAVDPVVLGKVRAKQKQRGDKERTKVASLLMHGDAAFAGQGLVAECLMMSDLRGYGTGGTIHFIVNNQIGFTTSPQYSRSGHYCSDLAKMSGAPIFHANGDDPEAVVFATKVATEFKMKFKKDVVVDMICYRRFGHNEADEPSFTQPLMYANIKNHPSVMTVYKERLIREGLITEDSANAAISKFTDQLEKDFSAGKNFKPKKADWLEGKWEGMGKAKGEAWRAFSGCPEEVLQDVGRALTTVPADFNIHRTLARIVSAKEKMFESGEGIDWATAEALAFATLLQDGYPVRLSGQDCRRGTFSHRHAEWTDQKTEDRYCPMNSMDTSAKLEVLDSPLSEAGVLGFEYGYSLAEPNTLTLWEAQFGDFANGAQVIIDQFISGGEVKWLRMSGLVMLLPHGYEGQGPEHSSARLERFLQLCGENNMQVANCTTPANYFHILRRQMVRNFRKPLIMMSPKSLLRHKRAVSPLFEMGAGTQFHRLLWDDAQSDPPSVKVKLKKDKDIKRVILCSGKVYYDLIEKRDELDVRDAYVLRFEQIYPFPKQPLMQELLRFNKIEKLVWCQEEPKNAGAWENIDDQVDDLLAEMDLKVKKIAYAGRPASAATAAGLLASHVKQQAELVEAALTE